MTPYPHMRQPLVRVKLRLAFFLLVAKCAVVLAVAAPVNASSEGALELNLTRAVSLALNQNLDVQLARIETAKFRQERIIARSDLLPHAQFDSDAAVDRYSLKARIGHQFPGVPYSIGPYQSLQMGPEFHGPLFDLTLVDRYRASRHRLDASKSDQQSVREEVVLLTVGEYMAHLRALASITASESRVALATRLAKQAADLRLDGIASKIDVSRAEVRLREEQQHLVDARRDADTTLFALKRILNVPDNTQILFSDSNEFFTNPDFNIENPLIVALTDRPELSSFDAKMKAASADRKAAIAEAFPTVTFAGQWNEQGQTFTTITPGYEYRLDLRVPLFTGGHLKADRQVAALNEQSTALQRKQAQNLVTEQVRDGEVELETARHQVALGKEEVNLANEEVTLSQGRFQAGVADNIEVVAAQDTLARANDAEIGALYQYSIARASLAHAVGRIEQTYTHP